MRRIFIINPLTRPQTIRASEYKTKADSFVNDTYNLRKIGMNMGDFPSMDEYSGVLPQRIHWVHEWKDLKATFLSIMIFKENYLLANSERVFEQGRGLTCDFDRPDSTWLTT